jgi:hypothetical protein
MTSLRRREIKTAIATYYPKKGRESNYKLYTAHGSGRGGVAICGSYGILPDGTEQALL